MEEVYRTKMKKKKKPLSFCLVWGKELPSSILGKISCSCKKEKMQTHLQNQKVNTNNLWGKTFNFPVGALYRALFMFLLYQEQSQFENFTEAHFILCLYTQTVEYNLDQASFMVRFVCPKGW